jgi:hypothetical protein
MMVANRPSVNYSPEWTHLPPLEVPPVPPISHPLQKACCVLQLTASASVVELIADTIPTAPNAATMARIVKARYSLFN